MKRGKHMRGAAGKVVVLGMMQRDGNLITEVVPNQRRATLLPIIVENVVPGGAVHTDELNSYKSLSLLGYQHSTSITAFASMSPRPARP